MFVLLTATEALAAKYSSMDIENDSLRNSFYELLRSGMGSFFIIFCAFGGVVTIFMTRGANSQKSTPIFGVLMLLTAIGLFSFRVILSAGLVGHEYLDFNR
jgi:uncharacterized membrane protein